ncbi:hypothetical protein HY734_03600 [Candidatus Uhrbacteria bacterium]|nr:hypothetical protein [Candidatus Uhrbacteria bacterium]
MFGSELPGFEDFFLEREPSRDKSPDPEVVRGKVPGRAPDSDDGLTHAPEPVWPWSYRDQFEAAVPFGPKTERAKDLIHAYDARILEEMESVGGVASYVERYPELEDAFTDEKPCLCCMDERRAAGTFRVPGSGILLKDEEKAAFRAELKAVGIKQVYTHTGCGAVQAFAAAHPELSTGKTDDEIARAYGTTLAAELGIEYGGHAKISGDHPGRAAYYDATGRLDTGNAAWQEWMPAGFSITRRILTAEQAMDALVLAVKIAFSEQYEAEGALSDDQVKKSGLAFTKENPFALIYVAKPGESGVDSTFSADVLRAELERCRAAIEAAVPESAGKIRIDGFTAPARPFHQAAESQAA